MNQPKVFVLLMAALLSSCVDSISAQDQSRAWRDVTEKFSYVANGRVFQLVASAGSSSPTARLLFYRAPDFRITLLSGSTYGVADLINAELQHPIDARHLADVLPDILVRSQLNGDVFTETMRQEIVSRMDAQEIPEVLKNAFLQLVETPRLDVEGARWSLRFFEVDEGCGVRLCQWSGSVSPFDIIEDRKVRILQSEWKNSENAEQLLKRALEADDNAASR